MKNTEKAIAEWLDEVPKSNKRADEIRQKIKERTKEAFDAKKPEMLYSNDDMRASFRCGASAVSPSKLLAMGAKKIRVGAFTKWAII